MDGRALPGPTKDAPPLRRSVAVVVALLSLLPNVGLVLVVLPPTLRDQPELTATLLPPLIAGLAAVASLSAFVGYAVSRLLMQPLTRLRDEVAALGAPGRPLGAVVLDSDERLPSEVAAVRRAFASLLDRLRDEQAKRGAFMATLVHDLKTPIIAANHVLATVRDRTDLGREERVALVASLLMENQRMLALVQTMVDAHRFDREELALALAPADLAEVAADTAERFAAPASERGLRIEASGSGRALASGPELERAVANLVENALRYARSVVRIEVDGASLTVADDGPGLPAPLDDLARPFNTQQVELAGRRFTSGTGGLGLFIARQIVAAHGGSLEHEPSAVGTRLRCSLVPA